MSKIIDQLGNKISITTISDVNLISGNNYTLSSNLNFKSLYTLNDLILDQKNSTGDAGIVYNQSMTAIVTKNNALLRFNNQALMVVLYTLNDKILVWGSKSFPVRCHCTPLISAISFEFICATPFPLIFED